MLSQLEKSMRIIQSKLSIKRFFRKSINSAHNVQFSPTTDKIDIAKGSGNRLLKKQIGTSNLIGLIEPNVIREITTEIKDEFYSTSFSESSCSFSTQSRSDFSFDETLSSTSEFDYTLTNTDKSESDISIELSEKPSLPIHNDVYICRETFLADNDETIDLDFLDRVELIQIASSSAMVKKIKTGEIGLIPTRNIELFTDFVAKT